MWLWIEGIHIRCLDQKREFGVVSSNPFMACKCYPMWTSCIYYKYIYIQLLLHCACMYIYINIYINIYIYVYYRAYIISRYRYIASTFALVVWKSGWKPTSASKSSAWSSVASGFTSWVSLGPGYCSAREVHKWALYGEICDMHVYIQCVYIYMYIYNTYIFIYLDIFIYM